MSLTLGDLEGLSSDSDDEEYIPEGKSLILGQTGGVGEDYIPIRAHHLCSSVFFTAG